MTCKALRRFVGSFYPTWNKAEFSRLLEVFAITEDSRTTELSGGMKAKLALSIDLAPRPEVLLLDEPNAGLAPVAQRELMEIIVEKVSAAWLCAPFFIGPRRQSESLRGTHRHHSQKPNAF